jgi:hypothetical protein
VRFQQPVLGVEQLKSQHPFHLISTIGARDMPLDTLLFFFIATIRAIISADARVSIQYAAIECLSGSRREATVYFETSPQHQHK